MKKLIIYTLLLLFMALTLNSYAAPGWHQGFARHGSLSKRPGLWKGLQAMWVAPIGVTGLGTDVIRDLSSYNNHGTTSGTFTMADWQISGDSNLSGYVWNFDGNDEYIDVGVLPNVFSTGFSVSIWISAGASDKVPFSWWHDDGNGGGFGIFTDGNWYSGNSGGSWISITAGRLTDSNFHLYTLTWNGANLNSYRDGVILGSPVAMTSWRVPDILATIGSENRTPVSNHLVGKVGAMFLHNRPLAVSQIMDMFVNPTAMFELKQRIYRVPDAPAGDRRIMNISQNYMQTLMNGMAALYAK